jgi:hypothetical protein
MQNIVSSPTFKKMSTDGKSVRAERKEKKPFSSPKLQNGFVSPSHNSANAIMSAARKK